MGKRKDIAEQLQQAVRDSEWSLNSLAKGAGIPQSNLHRFANGEQRISLTAAARLAELFQMRLSEPVDPDWSEYE